jgi:PAS domain S-box-containing protein
LNLEFVSLLESLANGVVIADATGTIIFSNQFLERMFGYGHDQLPGQRIEVLLPAELREFHARHRDQYNAAPETRLMGAGRDLLGRRKDGSVFPVEVGLSPMKTSEGMRVVAIVTDITTRKHAEQRSTLQRDVAVILSTADTIESVAFNLLETIALSLGWGLAALWLVNPASEALRSIAFWRAAGVEAHEFEAASRRLSFSRGGCLLGHVWDTGKPQWVSDLKTIEGFVRASEARTAGLRSVFELPVLVGPQMLGVLEFFSNEVRPPDDDLIGIAVAVASQIGQFVERKRSEDALGIFESRYRSLFENAVFGILRSTASGQVLDANPALVTLLGYDNVEEVLRLNLDEDVYKNTQDRQKLIASAMTEDRFDGFETEWKTSSGGTIQVRLSGRVTARPTGNLEDLKRLSRTLRSASCWSNSIARPRRWRRSAGLREEWRTTSTTF